MPEDETDSEPTEKLQAMAVWENHMRHATERWHEGVEHSGEEYRRGYAEAMGVEPEDVPDETVEHWKTGVMETGPDEFAASIAGEGSEWLVGFYERMTGEEPSEQVKEAAREVEEGALERVGEEPTDEELVAAVREEIKWQADEGRGAA